MTDIFKNTSQSNFSKMHKIIRKMLKKNYPGWKFTENHPVKINDRNLYLDFYITGPLTEMVIEVDGKQHSEFVEHFHKNRFNYEDSQYRDNLKEDWAGMNDIPFLRIEENFKLTDNEFTNIIIDKLKE